MCTPIVCALKQLANTEGMALHMPGHKLGQAGGLLADWLGEALLFDQTEIGPLDSLHAPDGPIRQAENLVADLYGTQATYFTTNGSSAGLIASLLTSTSSGAEVIVPRNMHKSVLAGIILADLWPRFITPVFENGFELGLRPADLQAMLAKNPEVQAVVLLHPTYEGVACELDDLIDIAKQNGCKVIVDEAHGAHFPFHAALPPSAVSSQADWVVQSAHKTLSALTGAAWVHRLNNDFTDEVLRSCLNLVQTTSPSWLLLGSLDLAQHELRLQGQDLLGKAIERANDLTTAIKAQTPFDVWALPNGSPYKQDPLKINLMTADSGLSGYAVAAHLESHGFYPEMTKQHSVLLMLTLADAKLQIEPLVQCLAAMPLTASSTVALTPLQPPLLPLVMRPRQAYLGQTTVVAPMAAVGRIAARPVYAYPPGAPLVYPGEQLSREFLAYIDEFKAKGGYLTGLQSDAWVVVSDR